VLQRLLLRREHQWARYSFSWLSEVFAGYGYHLWKSALWYIGTILVSTILYYCLGKDAALPLNGAHLVGAFADSVTAFHGRGISADDFGAGDVRSLIAAGEAMIGFVVEICLIVTFTQRFFEK
jgi:hypothetical protein